MKWSKRSPVWEYFELKNNREARCKTWDAVLKDNNSITNSFMSPVKSTNPAMSSGTQQPRIPTVLAKRIRRIRHEWREFPWGFATWLKKM